MTLRVRHLNKNSIDNRKPLNTCDINIRTLRAPSGSEKNVLYYDKINIAKMGLTTY
jgi:hypothetical protein